MPGRCKISHDWNSTCHIVFLPFSLPYPISQYFRPFCFQCHCPALSLKSVGLISGKFIKFSRPLTLHHIATHANVISNKESYEITTSKCVALPGKLTSNLWSVCNSNWLPYLIMCYPGDICNGICLLKGVSALSFLYFLNHFSHIHGSKIEPMTLGFSLIDELILGTF